MPEAFTATFGYLASAHTFGRSSNTSGPRVNRRSPTWSIVRQSSGWRSAIFASASSDPGTSTMSGILAFSAAGHSQSAVPSVSHGRCRSVWKVKRRPSMPGCLFQRELVAVALPRGRHDHDPADAGQIHLEEQRFLGDGIGFLSLGRAARRPRTVWRVSRPEVHLRVDDMRAMTPSARSGPANVGQVRLAPQLERE